MDKSRLEGLQSYENSIEALEKAESLVKVAGGFSPQDVTPEDFYKYLVTIGDLLSEAKKGFQKLREFIVDDDGRKPR